MKNKKILLVIIILLVLILVAFGGVYAYITLDIFRTPKQLFGKYLDNQIEQLKNMNTGALKTVTENLKTVPSQTEYSMKFNTDSDGNEIALAYKQTMILDPQNFAGMLKMNTTLENIQVDESISSEEENAELPLEVMDYTLYADKDKIVLKIPELNEKYFSITTDTLLEKTQETLKENNISNVELSKESIEKYKNEFKTLYNKYLEEVKTKFTEDKFSTDKKVEVDVNGTKLIANKYSFSISSAELKTMATDLLTQISDEQILLDFITEGQISSFKDNISTVIENIEMFKEDSTFKVCIYENSGNAVKLELQINDEAIAEAITTNSSTSEKTLIINVFNRKSEDGEVGVTQTIKYSVNSENENTTTTTVTSSTTYNKDDIEALKNYYEENDYYYYTDEIVEETYKDTNTTETVKTTVNGNTATSEISISDADNSEDKMQISDAKIEYEFGITPEFENFEDAIELEEYLEDEEKTMQLVAECIQNLQNHPDTLLGGLYGTVMNLSTGITEINPDENSYTENNFEDNKTEIETLVTDALNSCLESYQRDLEEDPNTNVADYLTVNKISEMMLSSSVSNLELIDGSTLKCKYNDEVFYIKLVLNAETLKVDQATAYTESEYEAL